MRHNQNRRSRGRSRKGPNPLTRSFESNGPDVKVRGTAAHVAEKYMSLARDAQSSGDPVAAENYLQHAEHYYRIVMAAQAQFQQSQPQFREGGQDEGYDDDRQVNGRGRDRFDYNGESRGEDDGGDDRFESSGNSRFDSPGNSGDGDDDRNVRPSQQQRPNEQGDRPRGPRPERYDRRERNDYREARPERSDRQDEPQPEVPAPAPAEAPAVAEAAPQPRRRRGRPPRTENAESAAQAEGEDATTDGAAALAAFPD